MGSIFEFTVLPLVFGVLWIGILAALYAPRDPVRSGPGGPGISDLAVFTLMVGVLLPPAAVLVGHTARRRMRRTGERGARLVTIGLLLGYGSVLCLGVAGLLTVDAILL